MTREWLELILHDHAPSKVYTGRCEACAYVRTPCLIAELAMDLLCVLDLLERAEAREDPVETEELRRAFDAPPGSRA